MGREGGAVLGVAVDLGVDDLELVNVGAGKNPSQAGVSVEETVQ